MSVKLCIFLATSISIVFGFDLGPSMRIAQCRSLCLRRHNEVKDCKESPNCHMCWETCGLLENDWTVWGSVCQDDKEICFAGCKTACAYHATRVEEQFLPSTLPAPMVGPVYLEAYDVAIVFRKIDEDWEETDQYSGGGVIPLDKITWVIVVAENGARQYSGEFWKPELETLKEGALYEASLSWNDADAKDNDITEDPEQREIDGDIARLNSRMALDFENDDVLKNALSHLKVSSTPRNSDEAAKIKLYFASDAKTYFDEQNARILADISPKSGSGEPEVAQDYVDEEERPEIYKEEPTRMETTSKNSVEPKSTSPSYIVSWEPEAGGLMGNQVTDERSTQISLLPGTKYLVRVASNDGPGSFALEIDTTVKSVQFAPLEAVPANVQSWAILAASTSALTFVAVVVLGKLCRRTTPVDKLDYV